MLWAFHEFPPVNSAIAAPLFPGPNTIASAIFGRSASITNFQFSISTLVAQCDMGRWAKNECNG